MANYALKLVSNNNAKLEEDALTEKRLLCGERISSYRVLRFLAQSYSGEVYLCQHLELPAVQVAMKVLRIDHNTPGEVISRFKNEFNCLEKLRHRSVVRAYKFFQDAKLLAYSMEYIPGITLADKLAENSNIEAAEALNILTQVCAAVHAIHEFGVIHRDIKPEHILFNSKNEVVLGGFSIARFENSPRITAHGGLLGTVSYLSPEYIQHGLISRQGDVYALGVLAFELLSGEAPFSQGDVYETLSNKIEKEAPLLCELTAKVSLELSAIIARALARKLDQRYASVSELLSDLLASSKAKYPEAVAPQTIKADPRTSEPQIFAPTIAAAFESLANASNISVSPTQATLSKLTTPAWRTPQAILERCMWFMLVGAVSVPVYLALTWQKPMLPASTTKNTNIKVRSATPDATVSSIAIMVASAQSLASAIDVKRFHGIYTQIDEALRISSSLTVTDQLASKEQIAPEQVPGSQVSALATNESTLVSPEIKKTIPSRKRRIVPEFSAQIQTSITTPFQPQPGAELQNKDQTPPSATAEQDTKPVSKSPNALPVFRRWR